MATELYTSRRRACREARRVLVTPPVEKCNLEGSLGAAGTATTPITSLREESTHLGGRTGPAGCALRSRTDVIKKDTSK